MTILGLARGVPDPATDALVDAIAQSSAELGIMSRPVGRSADEESVDITLYVGHPRLHARLLSAPRTSPRIAWFGEVLSRTANAGVQTTRLTTGPAARFVRIARPILGPLTRGPLPGPLALWREEMSTANACMVNLDHARRCADRVDRVVVTSRDRACVLREIGLEVRVVPFGYHPAGAGPLIPPHAAERDIAVAMIGRGVRRRSGRRGRILAQMLPAIERLGPVVLLDDTWGAERDAVLQRTRIVLDVQNAAGNFGGLRFITTLAAGAVLVTDRIDNPFPFESGVDHVEAPVEGLVEAVGDLLNDERRRRGLAEAGQARLRGELAMRCSLERVLAS